MIKLFSENSTRLTRALQIWQILIAKASNRQTLTYGMLAELMGYGSPRLGTTLEYIYRYCKENSLPLLTIIVVEKKTGLPAAGVPGADFDNFAFRCERVFDYDWYNLIPPTLEELETTYNRQQLQQLLVSN